MLILGIETSCDDTSVALLDCSEKGRFVISEKTASQVDIHKKYGGVVPEIAGRMHAEKIVPLIEETLGRGSKPDMIAVTAGPGLITGLIVGVEAARTLSYAWNIPLVAVNHIEGHIYSVEIPKSKRQIANHQRGGVPLLGDKIQNPNVKLQNSDPQSSIFNLQFPALALVVSGGHTELILMKDHGKYQLLGATKDDAAGECFDKVAKLLDLPYPGGPEISRLAKNGEPNAINFPRPMIRNATLDFSFAGLKTAALYWLRDNKLTATHLNHIKTPAGIFGQMPEPPTLNDYCASIEQAIVDVLVAKTLRAAKQYKPKTVILCGGVSANLKLRTTLKNELHKQYPISNFQYPISQYCMDNAAMIALAGFYHARKKEYTKWQDIKANPNWRLAE